MGKVIHKVFSGFTACCHKRIKVSDNVFYTYKNSLVTCKRCLAKLKKEKSK